MCKKLSYALWLKIACPGQITHQKFLFPLQDLTTAYKTMSQNFDIWFHSFVMSYRLKANLSKNFVSNNIYASLKLGTEWKD
jgi:hypothetical protein